MNLRSIGFLIHYSKKITYRRAKVVFFGLNDVHFLVSNSGIRPFQTSVPPVMCVFPFLPSLSLPLTLLLHTKAVNCTAQSALRRLS